MRWIVLSLGIVACNTDPVATVDEPGTSTTAMTEVGSQASTGAPVDASTSAGESTSTGALPQTGGTADESTGTPAGCGNGALEPGEDCDGALIREGITCGSLGFIWERGELKCRDDCSVDAGACVECGWMPEPPGGACPAACNGGCSDGTCFIDCAGGNCYDDTFPPLTCPPGWHCDVACAEGELGGCLGRRIECPADFACSVRCTGQGCTFADIRCSDGPCEISCDDEDYACLSTFSCGTNSCHATCAGPGQLAMGCYLSCDCLTCE
jgi:hypothetical protein